MNTLDFHTVIKIFAEKLPQKVTFLFHYLRLAAAVTCSTCKKDHLEAESRSHRFEKKIIKISNQYFLYAQLIRIRIKYLNNSEIIFK